MMQIKKNYTNFIYFIFIILSLIPFILHLFKDDIFNMAIVNFSFIVLCFLTTILTINKNKDNLLQVGAITFTLIADYFLTLKATNHTLAVFLFTIAQVFYFIRISSYCNSKEIKINIYLRIIIIFIIGLIILLFFKDYLNDLIIVTLFYYINFIINLIFAFIHYKNNKLLALGLLLFIICDTLIGFSEMVTIFNLNEDSFLYIISNTGYNIPWLFYIPSQVLLVISKNG